jgi:hypothetical protein
MDPGPLPLEGQQVTDGRVGRAGGQVAPADAEAVQVLGRQVHPAAGMVLGHIPDEVSQLEGQAKLAGVGAGSWGSDDFAGWPLMATVA